MECESEDTMSFENWERFIHETAALLRQGKADGGAVDRQDGELLPDTKKRSGRFRGQGKAEKPKTEQFRDNSRNSRSDTVIYSLN